MNKFITGVPNITFVNTHTGEELPMFYATDYSHFGDEITVEYAQPSVLQNIKKLLIGY